MKTKKFSSSWKEICFLVIFFTALTGLFISCKKEAAGLQKITLNEIAKILDGGVISGELSAGSDQEQLILSCKSRDRLVIIEKLPNVQINRIPSVSSGAIILSEFGVVVRDLSNNHTWLLVNNDEGSKKRFEGVKKLLAGDCEISLVFGTTVVNPRTS
jgi:hypothetical protein